MTPQFNHSTYTGQGDQLESSAFSQGQMPKPSQENLCGDSQNHWAEVCPNGHDWQL